MIKASTNECLQLTSNEDYEMIKAPSNKCLQVTSNCNHPISLLSVFKRTGETPQKLAAYTNTLEVTVKSILGKTSAYLCCKTHSNYTWTASDHIHSWTESQNMNVIMRSQRVKPNNSWRDGNISRVRLIKAISPTEH